MTPDEPEIRKSRSRERLVDTKEIPVAYRFTSSTVSSRHDTSAGAANMSEVERKKKLKQMKQKIKRSASASKVEHIKPAADPVVTPNRRSPPARLETGQSKETGLAEEQRKLLISKKVEELKRIRDLARAYAEGELDVVTGRPSQQSSSKKKKRSTDSAFDVPKKDRRVPVVETIEPANREIPMAAVQPSAPHKITSTTPRKQTAQLPVQSTDRFALPTFADTRKSKQSAGKHGKETQRQKNIEQQRNTNVSRYDNASPSDSDQLPKFPVLSQSDVSTLYDKQELQDQRKDGAASTSKVNSDIEALLAAITSSLNFWSRNLDDASQLAVESVSLSNNSLLIDSGVTNADDEVASVHVDEKDQLVEPTNQFTGHTNGLPVNGLAISGVDTFYSRSVHRPQHASLHEVVFECSHDSHENSFDTRCLADGSCLTSSPPNSQEFKVITDIDGNSGLSDSSLSLSNLSRNSSVFGYLTSDSSSVRELFEYEPVEELAAPCNSSSLGLSHVVSGVSLPSSLAPW